jgi:hypothetical protein
MNHGDHEGPSIGCRLCRQSDLDDLADLAAAAASMTAERNRRIVAALAGGASTRAVGMAAGLSHTAVAKIAARGKG